MEIDLSIERARSGRLPDFIICGAPKCGTTSLHFILKQHPDVGIPDNEIIFYDADDPIVHPDFLHRKAGDLVWFDPMNDPKAWQWYKSRFAPFSDKAMIGEDSPTYIFSEVAAARIAEHAPETKLIFTLRNPVSRAFSQYWHLVRSGRATASFEKTLVEHSSILLGSTYLSNLKRFIDCHGRERVHVVIFEDFADDPQSVIDGLTDFLGLSRMEAPDTGVQYNRSVYPNTQIGQQLLNRVGRHIVSTRYRNHMGQDQSKKRRMLNKLHYRWFRYINPLFLRSDDAPEMRPATRDFLAQHLSARNVGLSKLLDRDLSKVWSGLDV